jgi:formate hydrogenlyase transcriptional activator
LNVFPIEVPPLRERREDIEDLTQHFVDRCARRLQKVTTVIPRETLDALRLYDWPGNVRELENVVERSVILSPGSELIVPSDALAGRPEASVVGQPTTARSVSPSTVPQTLAEAERACVLAALEATNWVVGGRSGAAARLGLNRTTLQARMRKLGLSRQPASKH